MNTTSSIYFPAHLVIELRCCLFSLQHKGCFKDGTLSTYFPNCPMSGLGGCLSLDGYCILGELVD